MTSNDTSYRDPQSNRLRLGRRSEAGRYYLLTSATWRRRPVFADYTLGRVVAEAMGHHHGANGQATTLAFVVMPDHFHWLVTLGEGMTLARLMASVKGYTSREILRLASERFTAPLWQDGYHDHALRREEDVREVARYVVANPLRAGVVQRLADYPLWGCQWPEDFAEMCL